MRISVVSDVHGNVDALARVAERTDRIIVLGDLLDYVDYDNPAAGILGEMFGPRRVEHFTRLRASADFLALRDYNAQLWASMDDAPAVLAGIVRDRYRAIVNALGPDALVMLGNVDVASEWDAVGGDVFPALDSEVVEVEGVRFGFVAGGARRSVAARAHDALRDEGAGQGGGNPPAISPAWRPYLRDATEYRAAVGSLGPVDVLCSHLPADVPHLRFDTVLGKLEGAGPGLVDYIDREQPVLALSGHVHQPIAHRVRRGRTECVNVGHFRRTERPYVLDLDRVHDAIAARSVTAIDDTARR